MVIDVRNFPNSPDINLKLLIDFLDNLLIDNPNMPKKIADNVNGLLNAIKADLGGENALPVVEKVKLKTNIRPKKNKNNKFLVKKC